jgi:hypothetical protein
VAAVVKKLPFSSSTLFYIFILSVITLTLYDILTRGLEPALIELLKIARSLAVAASVFFVLFFVFIAIFGKWLESYEKLFYLIFLLASYIAGGVGDLVYKKPELAVYGVPLYFAFVVYSVVKGGVWGGVGAAALLALYATSLVPLWAVPAWIAAVVLALWYIAKRIGRSNE